MADRSTTDSGPEKSEFKLRDSIEDWVEGVVDLIQVYLRTIFWLGAPPIGVNLLRAPRWHLRKMMRLSSSRQLEEYSRPAVFFSISYIIMLFTFKYSYHIYGNPNENEAGEIFFGELVEGVAGLKIESIIVSLFPAILVLALMVWSTQAAIQLFRAELDLAVFRRNYSYAMGNVFLACGVIALTGPQLAAPPTGEVQWLSLLPAIALVLFARGVILPMRALHFNNRRAGRREVVARGLAHTIAIVIFLIGLGVTFDVLRRVSAVPPGIEGIVRPQAR